MKIKIFTSLLFAAFFTCTSLTAQVNIFIKFPPGIEGESTVRLFEKQVEATSFAQEESVEVATGSTGGAGAGKANTGRFVFTMPINKSVIGIKNALYRGTRITKVEISFVRTSRISESSETYYKIVLDNVLITDISDAYCGTCGDVNTQQVQMYAGAAEWIYKAQDAKGGLGPEIKFKWNFATNTPG